MTSLAELFPEEDYRFHLTLRRGDPTAFFAPSSEAHLVLAERRHWLNSAPARHAAMLEAGVPLLQTFARLVGRPESMSAIELGAELEPDFLLLAPDEGGDYRLLGGALCFPTGWSLPVSLGRTLESIHGVVPELNSTLASPIRQVLTRLKPGSGVFRANWGLSATSERNLHPELDRPRLSRPLDETRVWLRVEHQLLAGIDERGGVLFGIRVDCHPLQEAIADENVRRGLRRALSTMSEAVAAYKGLAGVREDLLRLLDRDSGSGPK